MSNDELRAKLAGLRREPPAYRRVTVRSMEWLTDHMVRVVLGGDELDGFAITAPASSVRLLLPPPGTSELVMVTWTGNEFELPDGSRPPIRTFTPRHFDHIRNELTLDIVVHDHGVATDWAKSASIGDEAAISGPGRSNDLDPTHRSYLLVGDEAAIPAIAQLLEWIPHDCSIEAHIEIRSPDAQLALPPHPRVEVTWHVAIADQSPGDELTRAVRKLDELPDAVWVAGEAASVQRLRTFLFDERLRDRSSVTARGYWKLGRSPT